MASDNLKTEGPTPPVSPVSVPLQQRPAPTQELLFWRYIRRVRWQAVYYALLAYVRDNALDSTLSSKMQQRIVQLADLVEYDPQK